MWINFDEDSEDDEIFEDDIAEQSSKSPKCNKDSGVCYATENPENPFK